MTARRPIFFLILYAAIGWALPARAALVPLLTLDVQIDPAENRLSAEATLSAVGGGMAEFHLSSSFRIRTLELDGRPVTPIHDNDILRLDLGTPGQHVIHVRYAGAPGPTPLTTAGGMLGGAANWVPVPDGGIAHHRIDIATRTPFKVVALGRLVNETAKDGLYRARFESEAPGEYPTVFIGPYRILERIVNGVRLRTYFHPELTPLAADYLDDTARYIERYADKIGPYPFSGFSVVSGPQPVGYGFPGLTYMGRRVLKLPFIRKTSLGHEVLHCWWGNGVFIDPSEGNWAEGLTTFMADYAFAQDKGASAARTMRINWLRDYNALPPERDRAAATFVSNNHDASQVIGYNKVAFFFHMLRDEIGADVFAKAIRRFWKDNRFKAATWSHLRAAFEHETGRDLKPYFSQWLNRPGAPHLRLEGAIYEEGSVTLTVQQDGPPFALSVPVRIETDSGQELTHVRITDAETRVRLPATPPPNAVILDPDSRIFRHLSPNEAPPILRDITLAKGVLSIIAYGQKAEQLAAKALVKRLISEKPFFVPAYLSPSDTNPFIVVGTPDEVAAYLSGIGLIAPPDEVANRGTAQVWTGRRGAQPYLIITAERTADITALLRPLPHYRRSSWLVFDGSKAIDRGTWPISSEPLSKRF